MSELPALAARVFTVSPGRPFLTALAEAVLAGNLPQAGARAPAPEQLPDWTILLPTRRAARALGEAFLAASGREALLLPRIRAIAEGQEELDLLDGHGGDAGTAADVLALPPEIGALERKLLLTRLVLAWAEASRKASPAAEASEAAMQPVPGVAATTPAQAAHLATELARLIDMVETEGVSLAGLAQLVPEAYSAHWQRTLEFLRIVTEFWPAHLAEAGLLAPADRRNRLLLGEARRLRTSPPPGPVIVAGVTGSVPATAELMRAVAALDHGAIVLPGLDLGLDNPTLELIARDHYEHPQHGLARLLADLGIAREAVRELAGRPLDASRLTRNRIVGEAMRPTGTLAAWRRLTGELSPAQLATGLAGVSLIEVPSAEDEAEVVALILRQALETPGRTAALVSPDRLLARRVAARLEAWSIRIDDSAGRPFGKTVPGSFLDLVAGAIEADFAPAELMALLKHPLTRLGLAAGDMRRRARNLELAALRTIYLGRGLASLEAAVDRARAEIAAGGRRHRSVMRLSDADWEAVRDLVRRLAAAFAPILAMAGAHPRTFAELVRAHVAVAEAVAEPAADAADALGVGAGAQGHPLWAREEGAAASLLMARLMDERHVQPSTRLADYPGLYRAIVAGESIRTRVPRHPRIFIWGPFEARLQQPDVVVIGSLNDSVWPAVTDPGPWLNRRMRAELGLPSPETETGRSAHDLVTLMGAERVYLTRAEKVGGVPMVASRWLLRLGALLSGLGARDALAPREPWLAWARARDLAPPVPPASQPAPCPPLALRPRRLSVSDAETWIANPYALYAQRILRLEALPALGGAPGPAERGQIVHETLARFTRAYPDRLPDDCVGAFMAIADEVIGGLAGEARVKAFWRPRLERFAAWLAETEPERRVAGSRRLVEVAGRLVMPAPGGPFELTARADRIDVEPGGLVISDYKTGALPSKEDVKARKAAQLPLEAAMAAAAAFPEVPALPVMLLRYIRATGGEPPGKVLLIGDRGEAVPALADAAVRDLATLVARYDDPATPYIALRRPGFDYRHDDFDHLARLDEWARGGGEEGEEA